MQLHRRQLGSVFITPNNRKARRASPLSNLALRISPSGRGKCWERNFARSWGLQKSAPVDIASKRAVAQKWPPKTGINRLRWQCPSQAQCRSVVSAFLATATALPFASDLGSPHTTPCSTNLTSPQPQLARRGSTAVPPPPRPLSRPTAWTHALALQPTPAWSRQEAQHFGACGGDGRSAGLPCWSQSACGASCVLCVHFPAQERNDNHFRRSHAIFVNHMPFL